MEEKEPGSHWTVATSNYPPGTLVPFLALKSVLKNDFKGNEKLIWILLIIFLPILGAILYFLIGSGKRLNN